MMQLSKQPYSKIWIDRLEANYFQKSTSSLAILKTGLSLPEQKQVENEALYKSSR